MYIYIYIKLCRKIVVLCYILYSNYDNYDNPLLMRYPIFTICVYNNIQHITIYKATFTLRL